MTSDKWNYGTGMRGFIGTRLLEKLDARKEETIDIPHDQILNFDYVDCLRFFFLSAYGNLAGQDDRYEIIRANIVSPGHVISAIMSDEFACDLFLFTSSSSVLLPVQTPYSNAKRAAEEMILASGVPACIVRPFSVTGVGEQKQHLIPTLIRSCFEREHMNLCLKPVHDFIDVEDVVDMLWALADIKRTGVIELGTGRGHTNEAILEMVQAETGMMANITVAEETRPYDSPDWVCKNPYLNQFKNVMKSIKEMVAAYKKEHAI